MNTYGGTSIAEPATFSGAAGQAWRVRLAPVGQRARPDTDATVDTYIVRVPGAHLCWDHWMLSLIHLRPIEGTKPAVILGRPS